MSSDGEEHEDRTTRRRFLRTTAVATAGVLAGCGGGSGDADAGAGGDAGPGVDASSGVDAGAPADDAGAEDAGPPPEPVVPPEETTEVDAFGIGVASGDATDSAAIVWTRHDGTAPLQLVVWEMDGETYARRVERADVEPADGGFVHHEVTGLTAGARYRYAFFEMDGESRAGRSPVGRFRAALAPSAMEPLVIGAVSCTKNGRGKDTLERAGERDDLDLFLMLGDTTYNDGASTVEEYRASWAESLASDGWRAVRRVTSVLATWDDHEVDNNFDPETRDLAAPTQVFFENLPLRRDAAAPDRIWKSMRWGLTAEVFVLDCRGERRPSTRGGEDVYLSREQLDWLKAGLRDSPCVFKLIVNSVPIGDMPFPGGDDRWEGYPTQREEILRFIDETPIDGVLWIGGDFHFASAGRVSRDGVGSTQPEILVGPGAQVGNPAAWLLREPQFDWSSTTNNYTSLELDPAARRIRVRWHDADASVIQTHEIDH